MYFVTIKQNRDNYFLRKELPIGTDRGAFFNFSQGDFTFTPHSDWLREKLPNSIT